MRHLLRIALATSAIVAALPATGQGVSEFAGDWTVDLSTKPGEVYTKPMKLELDAEGSVAGDFYNSDIENGRWKTDRGRTCVSLRTHDGVGQYHTSACLVGDHVEGQTWAEQRNLLFNWNATRTKAG